MAESVEIRTVAVTDEATSAVSDWIEIQFLSRWGSDYQLQRTTDLTAVWTNVGEPRPGNNGPMLLAEPLGAPAVVAKPCTGFKPSACFSSKSAEPE